MIDRIVITAPGTLIEISRGRGDETNLVIIEQKWHGDPVLRLILPWAVVQELRTALRAMTNLDE